MSASRSFRDALANGDIRRVLAAQASASATQYLVTTALAIHLVEELGAGSLWILSLRYLPAAVLGPLSAVPTDLLGPKRALLVLGAARGTLLAVAAVGLAMGCRSRSSSGSRSSRQRARPRCCQPVRRSRWRLHAHRPSWPRHRR